MCCVSPITWGPGVVTFIFMAVLFTICWIGQGIIKDNIGVSDKATIRRVKKYTLILACLMVISFLIYAIVIANMYMDKDEPFQSSLSVSSSDTEDLYGINDWMKRREVIQEGTCYSTPYSLESGTASVFCVEDLNTDKMGMVLGREILLVNSGSSTMGSVWLVKLSAYAPIESFLDYYSGERLPSDSLPELPIVIRGDMGFFSLIHPDCTGDYYPCVDTWGQQ